MKLTRRKLREMILTEIAAYNIEGKIEDTLKELDPETRAKIEKLMKTDPLVAHQLLDALSGYEGRTGDSYEELMSKKDLKVNDALRILGEEMPGFVSLGDEYKIPFAEFLTNNDGSSKIVVSATERQSENAYNDFLIPDSQLWDNPKEYLKQHGLKYYNLVSFDNNSSSMARIPKTSSTTGGTIIFIDELTKANPGLEAYEYFKVEEDLIRFIFDLNPDIQVEAEFDNSDPVFL
jgi:hypothetical protein